MYSDLRTLSWVLITATSCSSPEPQAATIDLDVAQRSRSCAGSMLMQRTGARARLPQTLRLLVLSSVWNCTTWLQPVPTQTLAMLKPIFYIIILRRVRHYQGGRRRGGKEGGQKQPESVTPPHTMIMMKQTTRSTTPKMQMRIFQFSQVMACLMVRVELTMSSDSADIVSVFLTRMSIFSSRSSSFCRSSFRIWLTSSVSFHSLATLSTSSGELQSSMLPRRVLAKSTAPYMDILRAESRGYLERKILRMLSRQAKAMRSEYLASAMTMQMRSSYNTQKMQLLAENLPYLREGEQRFRICCAVSTKFPLKGVNSVSSTSSRATTVYIKDISLQHPPNHQEGHHSDFGHDQSRRGGRKVGAALEWKVLEERYNVLYVVHNICWMIRIAFTLANNLAKHLRFSPTSIVEGREQAHLETLVARNEQAELTRLADQQAFNARLQNIACPYEREKEQIIYNFSDVQNNLSFSEAWLKLDDVEQRRSDETWRNFNARQH